MMVLKVQETGGTGTNTAAVLMKVVLVPSNDDDEVLAPAAIIELSDL